MKILYIAQKTPFPIHDGGCFAMDALIASLCKLATVDGLFISTAKHPFSKETEAHYAHSFRTLSSVFIDTKIRFLAAFLCLVKGKSYNLARFSSKTLRKALSDKLTNTYDFIVCDGLFAAQEMRWLRQLSHAQIIIRTHNIEHDIWAFTQENTSNFFKKWYIGSLATALKKEELQLVQSADLIWAITENDLQKWIYLGITTPVFVIPVALVVSEKTANHAVNSCFYLGSMNWIPNIQTVEFLTNDVWKNNSKLPKLIIAGSFSERYSHLKSDQVDYIGRVKSTTEFMIESGILVAPILSGSGIRIKLLEAISLGVPCITTQLGATGIDAEAAGILIAESANDWQKTILELSLNESLRKENAVKSKKYCAQFHSFEYVKTLISASLER